MVPVYKKGAKNECGNYRGISLLAIAGKVLTSILRSRINNLYEANLREEQGGFRRGRDCSDQVFALRQVFERRIRNGQPFCALFVDFAAAFDSVHRKSLWACLANTGIPRKLVSILKTMYDGGNTTVRVYNELTRNFSVSTGVKQGCIMSPCLFNIALDWIMLKATFGTRGVVVSDDLSVTDLGYADDLAYFGESERDCQLFLDNLNHHASMLGLKISSKKTKFIAGTPMTLKLNDEPLEQVNKFVYLGSTFCNNSTTCSEEINVRIGKASTNFGRLSNSLFRRRDITTPTKVRVFNSAIIPVLLYAAESWCYSAADLRKLECFQMHCLRVILGVSLLDKFEE